MAISDLKRSDPIFVPGHRGLLGSAVVAELEHQGFSNIITRSRDELDLTHQQDTFAFLKAARPRAVIHCAALVGGIQANSRRPAEFLAQNLMIQYNVIHGAHLADVRDLIFVGSNCMYPTAAPQPIGEAQLMQGAMEPSNIAYGAAKVAGVVQVDSYRKQYGHRYFSVVPASLYGPHDNFDPELSHVTAAMILKFHLAKRAQVPAVQLWGTGKPRRELLFARDAARGIILVLQNYDSDLGTINIGSGGDLSVREIGEAIAHVTGYRGQLEFDASMPDGNMRKLLDSSRVRSLGFEPTTSLQQGLALTYDWFLTSESVRGVAHSHR